MNCGGGTERNTLSRVMNKNRKIPINRADADVCPKISTTKTCTAHAQNHPYKTSPPLGIIRSVSVFVETEGLVYIKKMATKSRIVTAVICVMFAFLVFNYEKVEGRYLPTRSNTDKLDKLKELLREVSQ